MNRNELRGVVIGISMVNSARRVAREPGSKVDKSVPNLET